MKDNITSNIIFQSFQFAIKTLQQHFAELTIDNNETVKLANNYYQWIAHKTCLIKNEQTFRIPFSALPNTFSKNAYLWLREDKQNIFNKYYRYDEKTDKYIISTRKDLIPYADLNLLMHSLVLTRKSVVWVDFGVNVGSEFGGRHPAIILKNLDNSCIVIPLSSQQPKSDKFCVQINSVYGFPSFTRWANVTHIREIDNSRIDFLRKIGNVNSKVMQEISEKMHTCGIL